MSNSHSLFPIFTMVDQTKPTSERNSSILKQKYPKRYPTMTLIQQAHTSRLSGPLTVPIFSRQLYQPGMLITTLAEPRPKCWEYFTEQFVQILHMIYLVQIPHIVVIFHTFLQRVESILATRQHFHNLIKQQNTKPSLCFVVGCSKVLSCRYKPIPISRNHSSFAIDSYSHNSCLSS